VENQKSGSRVTSIACKNMCVGYQPLGPDPALKAVSKHISFEVNAGEILAIMGPSGSGKSTLLRGLLGRAPYVTGQVWVNGQDCSNKGGLSKVSHRVGLVPQTDVLVDELSMRENIQFFHTITVDSGLSDVEVAKRAGKELASIGLNDDTSKPLDEQLTYKRVGDGSGRKSHISGGQAKRANIAMELVNDPDVLIIDEPTSGLSSHDSLELVKKLKEIALRGKIVIVIIHQPSSEVFQTFDRLLLLDGGGQCVRSGPRQEVVNWLHQYGPEAFHCSSCASSFPDRIMEVIETRKNPDPSTKRPRYWIKEAQAFAEGFSPQLSEQQTLPDRPLVRPLQAWSDLSALFRRHVLVKNRDRFSTLLTYIAPPLLGLLFASVFSAAPPNQDYAFDQNGLFPQLVFMLIVCTLFLGMVSSAVEVIKDRPMLEREASRGLRMWAYFGTKFMAVMVFGTIQVVLLVWSATWVLQALHLWVTLFWVLWLVMALGVSMGLLVSVFSSTPTKAFNLIPLILLPQIVLGGALLPFGDMGAGLYMWEDKQEDHRPIVAAMMPSSWAHQMAMRAIYHASTSNEEPVNVAVADMRHISIDGFMSLKQTSQLKAEPLMPWVSTPDWWTEWHTQVYALDVLVVSSMALLAFGLGWAWVGKPYRLRWSETLKRQVISGLLIFGLPFAVLFSIAPAQSGESGATKGIDFTFGPRPMDWTTTLQHCRGLKSQVATLGELLNTYRNHPDEFVSGDYWVAIPATKQQPPSPAVLSMAKLEALPTSRQSDESAVMAARGVVQARKVNPLQAHRFLCVPLPRLLTP
jgi:ABC-type multidrug transport system ATPase subunit/ABC-type multidrug transport system permease subunit